MDLNLSIRVRGRASKDESVLFCEILHLVISYITNFIPSVPSYV